MGKKGRVIHVVIFKTSFGVSRKRIAQVKKLFEGLVGVVPGLVSVQWGSNMSPSKFSERWTEGCIMEFGTKKARNEFHFHPGQERIALETRYGFYDDVVVFDLEVSEVLEDIERLKQIIDAADTATNHDGDS